MNDDFSVLNSCGKMALEAFMALMWNLPAASTAILMAVIISRLSKPTFVQKENQQVKWAQDFNLVNYLNYYRRKHSTDKSDREER